MNKTRTVIAWLTIVTALLIIAFWSYWGINETFHENWYHTSLVQNLYLTFIQYLSVPLILLVFSILAIYFRKIGTALFVILGIFAVFFFHSNAGRILIFIPLILFALGFYFGEYKRKKIIALSLVAVFLLIILGFGIPQLIRVENRYNDNNFGNRIVIGNNVKLTWVQQGPGFPLQGTDWQTARDNCTRLNESGDNLVADEVNIWRLPTRDEIVKSLTRKNQNAGGIMNDKGEVHYDIKPDKETPLWNPHSQIIYYWTSETKDGSHVYLVGYNGYVLDRDKGSGADYQGYRCVKE